MTIFSDPLRRKCAECGRTFDLNNEEEFAEWAYVHDCEVD